MLKQPPDIFADGGDAGRRLSEIDWASNPLGPVYEWPPALRIAVQMTLASYFPKAVVWGDRMIMIHNDAFKPILGHKPCAQGEPFPEVWSEAWPELEGIAARAMAGQATFIENFPLTIERHGFPEACNFTFCYSPLRDEEGRVGGFMDTVIETTEVVRTKQGLETRNAELSHRLKNAYSIVSVIARQTLNGASDLRSAWETLGPRLRALSEAHASLSASSIQAAPIDDVIERALLPHFGDMRNVTMSGPTLQLPEREALSISLAVNELATNGLKHGSLASDGTLRVEWSLDPGPPPVFRFRWFETGAPAPEAGRRKGFGSQLLEQIIPMDFQGTSTLTHSDGNLEYLLEGHLPV